MPILIDSGYVSDMCSPGSNLKFEAWLESKRQAERHLTIFIPEIVDYEVRRGFLYRIKKHRKNRDRDNARRVEKFLARLDLIGQSQHVRLLPTTKEILERAADLWGAARAGGYSTAPEERIDVDVIVASHALEEGAEVATTDARDYPRYGVSLVQDILS